MLATTMSVRERDPVPTPRTREVTLPPVTAGDFPGFLGSAFIVGSIQGCWSEYRIYATPQVSGLNIHT